METAYNWESYNCSHMLILAKHSFRELVQKIVITNILTYKSSGSYKHTHLGGMYEQFI